MKQIIIIFVFISINLYSETKFLVFGGNGWIGSKICRILEEKNYNVYLAKSRLEDRESIAKEIKEICPNFVINAAGKTGISSVDWCEDHKQETIRSNVLGALNLVDVCYKNNIHVTNLSTGCIYQGYPENGFTEKDEPNFLGSFYSRTKILLEKLIINYPNVLHLRIKMPISSDLSPRSFVVKITKYKKIINMPNSVSILDDLLPLVPEMCLLELTGIFNFVNPGILSHNQVLELYKKYIDNNFKYTNFTVEEQNAILKSQRSNCSLDASKLLAVFPYIPDAKDSIIKVFEKIKALNEYDKL
ncbi:hypothetical protein A3F66_05285 [candidate division TM6 bacterium RIFCSPHIGHO2_12_FULL_32_22]|nr:MAG: hypothetical protein A3F66_05285 [candidate division TM6 bacterium RIFCSPHIGHO2_12_FULL_32_22]